MRTRTRTRGASIAAGLMMLSNPMRTQDGKPFQRCPEDSVVSGTVCMDRYEASVWRVPDPTTTNKGLVKQIELGTATLEALVQGGATQLGVSRDDYAPCADSGQGCTDRIYALSLPGVTPSSWVTWFQAQQACKNARKRLPSNAEWQAAVAGTPDRRMDHSVTGCNTKIDFQAVATGARGSCVSADGAFDMVGNLEEWVADWVPQSTGGMLNASASPEGSFQHLDGAAPTGEPGVLLRNGRLTGTLGGPLVVDPSFAASFVGFRCAR